MRTTYEAYPRPHTDVVNWEAGHAARIHQIETDVRPNGAVYSVSDLRRHCTATALCGRVVRFDRHVIGYALFYLRPQSVEIHRIGVDPEWQGQKIGRYLVRTLYDEFLDWNRPRLYLDLMESTVAAHEEWALKACHRLSRLGFSSAVAATASGPAWRFTRRFDPTRAA